MKIKAKIKKETKIVTKHSLLGLLVSGKGHRCFLSFKVDFLGKESLHRGQKLSDCLR